MVLNTVGASSFGQSLGRAQDSINRVTLSINRASQAAKTGRVSAEMQKAANDRLTASYNLAGVKLDLFRMKMHSNLAVMGKLGAESNRLAAQVNNQQRSVESMTATLERYQARGGRNTAVINSWTTQIRKGTERLAEMRNEQDKVTKSLSVAAAKETSYQAQLRGREARLESLRIKVEQTHKPLTRFESFIATLMQIYHNVDRVSRTFDRLTLTINRTLRIIERVRGFFGGGGLAAKGGMMGAVPTETLRSQESLGAVVMRNTRSLGLMGTAAAFALGQTIVNLGANAIRTMVGIGQSALSTVSSFERLNISLRSMLAVQAMNAGASMDMQAAIKLQTGAAAKLVRELEKIGIASPFSVEAVKQAFQQGMGMGFAADQALRLTKASLDWASATGKAGYAVEHAVFVMAQMRSAGKLVYQDLYQLAQLGIGMEQINISLAKSLGKTVEEVRRLRDAGKITAAQGIEAITQYMEQFQGAAKDQAQTLEGLINSLGDIGPIFLRNFFGPLDLATGKVQGILGSVRMQLSEFVTFLQQDWVVEISRRIGVGLGGVADRAIAWGRNIVASLAQGIYQGAIELINALTYIGNLLAYWLAPGSPPRLLPDLPKWGAAAMSEFFRGFGLADLGSFRDITGMVEQVLRSAVTSTGGEQLGIIEKIFGSRTAIGNLINELRVIGSVSEDTFQRVFSSLGDPSDAVQNYLRAYVALAQQSKAVRLAQDELNRVTKYYGDLLKPVEQDLTGISNAQQDLTDANRVRMLELVQRDPNASATEKEMARLEIEKLNAEKRKRLLEEEAGTAISAAQARLEAEETRMTAMQEELSIQQALIEQEMERNRLMQEYINLLERMAQTGGGGGGGGEGKPPLTPPIIGGFPNLPEPGAIAMPDFITDLTNRLSGLQQAWVNAFTAISNVMAPVKTALEGVKTSWNGMLEKFAATKETVLTFITDAIHFLVTETATKMPQVLTNISRILDEIGVFWEEHHVLILGILNAMWRAIVVTVIVMGLLLTGLMAFLMQVINGNWEGAWKTVEDTTRTSMQAVLDITGQDLDKVQAVWEAKLTILRLGTILKYHELMKNDFVLLFQGIIKVTVGFWTNMFTLFGVFLKILLILLGVLFLPITAAFAALYLSWENLTKTFGTLLATYFTGLLRFLRALVTVFAGLLNGDWEKFTEGLKAVWENAWNTISSISSTIIEGIMGQINGLLELLNTLYQTILGIPQTSMTAPESHSRSTVSPPATGGGGGGGGNTVVNNTVNYNLGGVTSNQASQGVIFDFAILEAMGAN